MFDYRTYAVNMSLVTTVTIHLCPSLYLMCNRTLRQLAKKSYIN